MTKIQYLASLREKLLQIASGVEDARQWSKFILDSETTPNAEIRRKLTKVVELYIAECKALGVYVVREHSKCDNPDHGYLVMEDGPYNFYDDRAFEKSWPIGEATINCICPCSAKNKTSKHEVIYSMFYDKEYDRFTCDSIRSILEDLISAYKHAEDKRPRSAIREYLFRAVLKINDLILPVPMDEYVSNQLQKGP